MAITSNATTLTFNDATTQTTAAAASIPTGTVMLFAQTTAPTGFTKNTTTGDNSALRVTTGAVTTGGSVNFSTAFVSQAVTGSVTSLSGTVGNTTLSTPQIPSHSHLIACTYGTPYTNDIMPTVGQSRTVSSNSTGGGGAHNHPFSGSGTFSGNAINLAVKFVDVIQATKN